jgi:hypothetical protein
MMGSMYLPSVTDLFLAKPPMYFMTGRGAPMQQAADTAPFRRLCDVHLKPDGAVVLIARRVVASHDKSVAAAVHFEEASKGEKL